MKYYIGGYYLVEGNLTQANLDDLGLSKLAWSTSDACFLHPPILTLPWVKSTEKERDKYQKKLDMDEAEFRALQEEVDSLFNQDKIGWISMFTERDAAIRFALKYLQHIPNVKLLMIATTEEYRNFFIEAEKPKHDIGTGGVYNSLKKGVLAENKSNLRGFDILAYELGEFQSFLWNDPSRYPSRYVCKILDIRLNENGLVKSYEDAERLIDYIYSTNIDNDFTFSGGWMSWAILEI